MAREGRVMLPNDWIERFSSSILEAVDRELTITSAKRSPDKSTVIVEGWSSQFEDRDDKPMYVMLIEGHKHNVKVRFRLHDALAKRVHENEVYSEIGMPHLKDRVK